MSQAWFRVDDYFIARDLRGIDHIIGELRRKRLYLALASYGLFYQGIFVFDMIYFNKKRHLKLSLDMFLMSFSNVGFGFLFLGLGLHVFCFDILPCFVFLSWFLFSHVIPLPYCIPSIGSLVICQFLIGCLSLMSCFQLVGLCHVTLIV